MQQSSVGQKLFQVLVVVLGLGLALVLGQQVAHEQYRQVLLVAFFAAAIVLYFFAGKYFWAVCFSTIFFPINLPFLPLGMKPFEAFLLAALFYYFINDIALQKNFPKAGIQPDGLILALALVVILAHGVYQRFGVRLLGAELWGGRAYLTMIGSGIAYYCLQSTSMPLKVWNKLPWVILVLGTGNFLLHLGFQVSPNLFSFVDPYGGGNELEFSRWGFLGNYGYLLIITGFSLMPINRWLNSPNLLPFLSWLIGTIFCFLSGYRSSSLIAISYFFVGAWRDLKAKALGFLFLFSVVAAILSMMQGSLVNLPRGIQRGLVWLPGDWDPSVKSDAVGSDDFRFKTWTYFINYQFPDQMWFGRGLAVPYQELLANLGSATINPETGQTQNVFQDRDYAFYISGNLHNGFLSTLDRFGIIGGLFVFILIISAFLRFMLFMKNNRPTQQNFALQWIALYGAVNIIGFPMGALRIDDFLPVLFITLGIFNSLKTSYELEQAGYPKK